MDNEAKEVSPETQDVYLFSVHLCHSIICISACKMDRIYSKPNSSKKNPEDYYKLADCFHLLSILFNPYFNLVDQMVTTKGCCVVFFADWTIKSGGTFPALVKVIFLPYSINYKVHDVLHVQDDRIMVEYIYYIMKKMNLRWMQRVLSNVMIKPTTLVMLCKKSLYMGANESVLRRFLTPAMTILRDMCFKGRMCSAKEYGQHFKNLMLSTRTLSQPVQYPKDRQYRETIYMHDYFLYGLYSYKMNFYTLPYMLLAEAVLVNGHKWEEIYNDCFHCQIEEYHMIVWRHRWPNNYEIFIFLNEQLACFMKDRSLPYQDSCLINHPKELLENLTIFQYKFCDLMLEGYFANRFPMKVNSLKHLCEFQMAMAVLMRRLYYFWNVHMQLKSCPSVIEADTEYQKCIHEYQLKLWSLGERCHQRQWRWLLKGTQYFMTVDMLASFKRILIKGTKVPLLVHHTVAKLSDSYRVYGPALTQDYDILSPNV